TARVADASGRKHDGSAVGAPAWRATGGPGGGPGPGVHRTTDSARLPRGRPRHFTLPVLGEKTPKGGGGPGVSRGRPVCGGVDGEVAGVTDDFGTALVGDRVAFGVGKPDTTIKSATAVNDGRWHHVAAVRSRAAGAIRLFVDGKQEAAGTAGKQSLTAPQSLM